MTVNPSIDPARLLEEQLAQASPDLLRELLGTFINTLLSAEADAVCGAGYGERSPERVNSRNGYRHRDFDTRAGTLDVAIPKLRQGSYFPSFLEPRKRSEQALLAVVQQAYVCGVSTRRVDQLVERLGLRISKSDVSRICEKLDEHVQAFRTRPLIALVATVAASVSRSSFNFSSPVSAAIRKSAPALASVANANKVGAATLASRSTAAATNSDFTNSAAAAMASSTFGCVSTATASSFGRAGSDCVSPVM